MSVKKLIIGFQEVLLDVFMKKSITKVQVLNGEIIAENSQRLIRTVLRETPSFISRLYIRG